MVHTADDVVPTRRQRKLAGALPNARTVEVPGDHLAVANDGEHYVPALLHARSLALRHAEFMAS